MSFRIEPCSHEAAKYAVMKWHYSKRMPSGRLVKFGVWEDAVFVGAVLFGRGANKSASKSLGFKQSEACELVRVALGKHATKTTAIVAMAIRLLRKKNPGLRLVFSYADWSDQSHLGVIYQAGNWIHLGERKTVNGAYYEINGQTVHGRTVIARYGSEKNIPGKWKYSPQKTKLLYVMPLDKKIRSRFSKLAVPYPKRAGSIEADASGLQPEEGGSIPTPALQI